ncbi:MAG TPA: hypothetical protein PLI70_01425 [Gemmatimonadales bacterium]|nr:hypothetical protein [Gemmatimonadales bacterium]HRZ08712.1 hypothetical protein [Gemmatimonadales bacterium]
MRYLYLIAGSAIALAGAYYIVNTFIQLADWMDEIGVIAGLLFLYLGTLNILNYWYGSKARGVRWAAVLANIAMMAVCWVIGASPEGLEWGLIGALVIAAALSLSARASRPA